MVLHFYVLVKKILDDETVLTLVSPVLSFCAEMRYSLRAVNVCETGPENTVIAEAGTDCKKFLIGYLAFLNILGVVKNALLKLIFGIEPYCSYT